ncbi:MAG: 5-(carboxyamino)imidazole ribonucleotide mutase [Alphaproteobacteria bacterium]|nr:5-(carboxyamino)imidazole ribonucleotide mutase [Alphaproteobacteria bacterium]
MVENVVNPVLKPVVAVIMGSQSDWETMQAATKILSEFGVPFEAKIMSAHRTLPRLMAYGEQAVAKGLKVIIAGAGGAAALPGILAALTTLPVLGVPIQSKFLDGMDSLLSMAQMPGGIPVGTLAVGNAGAKNAALLAISILALNDPALAKKLIEWRSAQAATVPEIPMNGKK